MILIDYVKPDSSNAVQPARQKVDKCLLAFLRAVAAYVGKGNTAVDPTLLQNVWPTGLTCHLEDCVDAAVAAKYVIKIERTVSITQLGREILAAGTAA